MQFRSFHVLWAVLLFSFFSCSKEHSLEKPIGSGGNNTGNFRAKIDGTDWVAVDNTISVTVLSGLINITGTSSDNKAITLTILSDQPGTYTFDQNSSSLASLDEVELGGPVSFTTNQSSDPAQSGGTVTITHIDQTNKTISGTFSFNGFDSNSGVKKVITEGVFQNLPYSNSLPPASSTDTLTVKIGGVPFTAASIAAPIISGSLFVQGAASNGTSFVGLYMPQNVQPGTYTLDFFGGTFIGQYSPDPNTILVSQGKGTLTIIENNTTTKRIKGNFSFEASDVSNTQTVLLTEGYFSVGY